MWKRRAGAGTLHGVHDQQRAGVAAVVGSRERLQRAIDLSPALFAHARITSSARLICAAPPRRRASSVSRSGSALSPRMYRCSADSTTSRPAMRCKRIASTMHRSTERSKTPRRRPRAAATGQARTWPRRSDAAWLPACRSSASAHHGRLRGRSLRATRRKGRLGRFDVSVARSPGFATRSSWSSASNAATTAFATSSASTCVSRERATRSARSSTS